MRIRYFCTHIYSDSIISIFKRLMDGELLVVRPDGGAFTDKELEIRAQFAPDTFQQAFNKVYEMSRSYAREYIIEPIISHATRYINRFTKHRTVDKRALLRTRLHKYI